MSCGGRTETDSAGLFGEAARLDRAVLATPAWWRGSVPFGAGARLLVREDGSARGAIGGGRLEAKALAAAREVLATGRPRLLEFDLTQEQAAEEGMICGGRCAVLLQPLAAREDREALAAVAEAEAGGLTVVVVSVASEQAPRLLAFLPDRGLAGRPAEAGEAEQIEEAARLCLQEGAARFLPGPPPVVLDPVLARPRLIVFGAGHIAVPLVHLAALVGFRVTVVDDRADFASRARFPAAEQVVVSEVEGAFAHMTIGEQTYIVSVTRGHALDEEVAARALRTAARYIGMIGSKRKVGVVRDRLRARGFSEEDLARLHAPIGLDIGSETVEEIAVSIVAELIAVRRGRVG